MEQSYPVELRSENGTAEAVTTLPADQRSHLKELGLRPQKRLRKKPLQA
jgi:hypothetical protein